MPDFTFTALGRTGSKSSGTLSAGSEREVVAMLDAKGLFPVEIALAKGAATSSSGRGVSGRHLATFYAQLADLLHAGVPLLRSLETPRPAGRLTRDCKPCCANCNSKSPTAPGCRRRWPCTPGYSTTWP